MEAAMLDQKLNEKQLFAKGIVGRSNEFFTENGTNLADLWDNHKKFSNQIKEMKKKINLNKLNTEEHEIVYYNKKYWENRNNKLNIFRNDLATEDKMNELIQQEDKENIILYASYGHITENFLKWLLIEKKEFNKTRKTK